MSLDDEDVARSLVAALQRARQRLQADVVCASVSAERDKPELFVELALLRQRAVDERLIDSAPVRFSSEKLSV